MNWRRIQHDDKDPKHYKHWVGGHGLYQIIWRDRVYEVTVPSGYHILVKVDGEWDLISRGKRLKRTLKAAKRVCEQHANPPKRRKSKKPTRPRRRR